MTTEPETAVAEPEVAVGETTPPDDEATTPATNGRAHTVDDLADIIRLERECSAAKADWESAKEEAKEAREYFDGKVAELMRRIRDTNTPLPLFDRQPSANGRTDDAPPPDDSWKQTPLTEVLAGIPPKKLEILEEAGLKTLGELEVYRAGKGEYAWDLKGIGPETRGKIEEKVLNWLAKALPIEAHTAEAAEQEPTDEEEVEDERGPGAE